MAWKGPQRPPSSKNKPCTSEACFPPSIPCEHCGSMRTVRLPTQAPLAGRHEPSSPVRSNPGRRASGQASPRAGIISKCLPEPGTQSSAGTGGHIPAVRVPAGELAGAQASGGAKRSPPISSGRNTWEQTGAGKTGQKYLQNNESTEENLPPAGKREKKKICSAIDGKGVAKPDVMLAA